MNISIWISKRKYKQIVARKEHNCGYCNKNISPGNKYIRTDYILIEQINDDKYPFFVVKSFCDEECMKKFNAKYELGISYDENM